MNLSTKGRKGYSRATFTSGSATQYTAGDSVGVAQALAAIADSNGQLVTLDAIIVRDSAGQAINCKILLFDGSAPATADNAAFAWGAALPNLVGAIDIEDGDYQVVASSAYVVRSALNRTIKLSDTDSALYAMIITGGAPTYGNGGTLVVDFHFSY